MTLLRDGSNREAEMLSCSDVEMIESCLSINISVTFILSAAPGSKLGVSVQYFNIKFSLSLSAEISYQMLNFSDLKILRLKVNLTVRAPGRYWPQLT